MGQAEDEIRMDAEDALGAIEGLEVRRMFSGWGFYQYGLLFAAAWEGEFRYRTRQGGHWIYEVVERDLPVRTRPRNQGPDLGRQTDRTGRCHRRGPLDAADAGHRPAD